MEPLEPTSSSNEELSHRNLKALGPMGWSADHPTGPTDLLLLRLGCSWVHLSMVEVWVLVMLNFFSGGPFDPCEACVTVFDRTASCSLAEKGMIALHFQLKPALIEI